MGLVTYPPIEPVPLSLLRNLKQLVVKYPWRAVTGIVTGSVLITSLCHKHSIKTCSFSADLTGKTVVITGGDEGIGKATAMELARRNAQVIIGSKCEAQASQVVKEIKGSTGNNKIHYRQLDLCSFKSTDVFIDELYRMVPEVNLLINSADCCSGKRKITEDGCERMMQSNYLGHFLLTLSLEDLMRTTTGNTNRIINVTSMGHQLVSLDLEDMNSSYSYSPLSAYLKSKLACMLFTTELPTKLQHKGITVNAVNPGFVKTNRENSSHSGIIMWIIYLFYGKTAVQGAQTILHVALSPELQEVSGSYFRNCKQRKLPRAAKDKELATKLYKLSEDIVGFNL